MSLDEIKALIAAMGQSDLAEMEVAKDGWTLRLVRHAEAGALASARPPEPPLPAAADRTASAPGPAAKPDVRAPLAGLVYLAPSPDAAPFVAVGAEVEAGALLCTVEAMKTFNEVRAEHGGTVEAVLVSGGDEVEAGQPLFRMG